MGVFNEKVRNELQPLLAGLPNVVTLKYFGQEVECRLCKETRELLQELAGLSENIRLETYDFIQQKAEAEKMGIERIPAIAVFGEQDSRIRFYGIPSGYEFTSMVEAIKLVSTGQSLLSQETREFLPSIQQEIHLQVFVTPTCPYCPSAVILAHQIAFLSPLVRADMIEATEFPQMAQKYHVLGVPRTVINETEFIEGAAPEKMILEKIKTILKKNP